MPVSRNDHHTQFSATPCSRTRLVTRLGVSVLNVVATIDTPMSHHGAARPDVKNSAVLDPARRQKNSAGMNEITIEARTTNQSAVARCILPLAVVSDAAKIRDEWLPGYIGAVCCVLCAE